MYKMKTKFYQMANLLETWAQCMDDTKRHECFLGTRIKVTVVDTDKIVDACAICCRLDFLRLQGLEKHL
jgi:hypothetical protein